MFEKTVNVELGEKLKNSYQTAEPFPHIVIDDFLPLEVAEKALSDFPPPEKMDPRKYQSQEHKIAVNPTFSHFPDDMRGLMYALNSHEILSFLEVMTGISGLLPDPTFLGGGLHQTLSGGKLGVHVDFNYHKHYRLNRRINIIIFLNKDWKEEYGGHLELWNEDMTECIKKVAPKFNRAAIFNTTDNSYHGHPDPTQSPNDITRKSIALYYYSSGRPEDNAKEVFWTEHLKRPNAKDYKFEPKYKKAIRQLTPPIIYNLFS